MKKTNYTNICMYLLPIIEQNGTLNRKNMYQRNVNCKI